MAYHDEMQRSGAWLFRWRSYLPLLFIGVLLLSMLQFNYLGNSDRLDEVWEIFCLIVSGFGLAIRCYTVGYTPTRTSGRNAQQQVADQLNRTGIYSVVRHPLYLGNFFIWLGISLFPHNWLVALVCICIYWLYYERIILAEEAFIRKKFGPAFEAWADITPSFIPNLRLFEKSTNDFSLRNVLKKEYPAFSAIIFAMAALEVTGDYVVLGKFRVDTLWIVLFALAISVHLILRILKKHTRLLHVPGR